MELRQLRYFVKVAETLNFSDASKQLFITQSTLSQQISNMEKELGQQLFMRNSHEVLLTEAGQTLLPHARETLNKASNCINSLQELKGMMTGELNIGVTFSFCAIVREALISFLKKYPRVKMNVVYSPMNELLQSMLRHELDLVLAFRPTQRDSRIESHVLFNNRLAAVVRQGHTLARQSSVTLEQLKRYDLVLPAIGLQARNAFERILEGTGIHFEAKAEMNNVDMLFKVIRESNYVTILSESTAIDEPDLKAVILDAPANDMEGCIHLLRNAYVKTSAKEFIHQLVQSTAVYKNTFFSDFG
ncbi:MAG: LysR family transcriptional regulator [Prevotella sp.]|nr:LysR family transcriptional regulator [Prevotella sp.]